MAVDEIPGKFFSYAYVVIECIRGLFQQCGNFTAGQTKTLEPYKQRQSWKVQSGPSTLLTRKCNLK